MLAQVLSLNRRQDFSVTQIISGINLSFAVTLLEKGCNVVMADLKLLPEAKELLDTHSTLREGRRAIFQKTDVSKWRDLTILFKKTVEEFGAVDIVVPGAGIYEPVSMASPLRARTCSIS